MAQRRTVAGLAMACHPGPSLAVTTLATLLCVAAGATARGTVLVAAAFGTGQLSIGWGNDWWDAARDRAVGRRDKPVASGLVSRRVVGAAAALAVVATVPISLALGWLAGSMHLVAVGAAWAYNLVLKGTLWSWLPFAVGFGLLPAVVTLALPDGGWPAPWLIAAGALLGVGAHLINVLPDLDDDRATGVRGLAHRLGRRVSAVLAPLLLLAACGLVAAGPPGAPDAVGWLILAAAAAAAVVAVVVVSATAPTGARRRLTALLATAVVALACVALLLRSGLAR